MFESTDLFRGSPQLSNQRVKSFLTFFLWLIRWQIKTQYNPPHKHSNFIQGRNILLLTRLFRLQVQLIIAVFFLCVFKIVNVSPLTFETKANAKHCHIFRIWIVFFVKTLRYLVSLSCSYISNMLEETEDWVNESLITLSN